MPVILKIIWLERSDNRSTRFAFDKNWVLVQMFCSDLAPGKARDRHDGCPTVIVGLLILLRCILRRSHKFSVSLDLPWGGLDVGAASEIYHKTKIGQPSRVHP